MNTRSRYDRLPWARYAAYACSVLLLTSVTSLWALAQSAQPTVSAQTGTTVLPTTPLVTTSFTAPVRPENPAFTRMIGACVSIFHRTLQLQAYDHPPDLSPAHDTLFAAELQWRPLPADAIAAARQCYHHVYRTPNDVADADLHTLLLLAIAMNEDSLVDVLVHRLVAQATGVKAKAEVLDKVVSALMTNSNPISPPGRSDIHLTAAHVALAHQYLTQLEQLGPQALATWLDAHNIVVSNNLLDGSDSSLDAAIADAHHVLDVLRAAPLDSLSAVDRKLVHTSERNTRMLRLPLLAYYRSLSHADLTTFVQLDDSVLGIKRPWLVGTPAPPLTANYWFGLPSNDSSPVLPAPHTLSLIVFVDPTPGEPATSHLFDTDAQIRRLHTRFPSLHIILVAVTKGYWANENLTSNPKREAQLMYHYVHDSLSIPGVMGVVTQKTRMVANGHTLPLQLPLFDHYMVDVRDLGGQFFLVDTTGWVVSQYKNAHLELLVRRLLSKDRGATP